MKLHEVETANRRISKYGIAALSPFFKLTEYITSTFDIHYSIFDIRFFKSFLFDQTKLAGQASGGADT